MAILRRYSGLTTLILCLCICLTESASGQNNQTNKGGKGAKKKKVNPTIKIQDNILVRELEITHKLIARANPTYKGHRAKAMSEIKHAIVNLEHEMKKHGHKKLSHGDGKANESKPLSDAQLRESARELAVILQQLQTLPKSKFRTKAAGHLATAVSELDIALRVTVGRKK